jgi:hypothetical protein
MASQGALLKQWFYPRRCEYEGCESREGLKRCGQCKMVMYCGAEHQAQDWKVHKLDCEVFQRNEIKAEFYTDDIMLAKFPFRAPIRTDPEPFLPLPKLEGLNVCAICNSNPDPDRKILLTDCCGNAICESADDFFRCSDTRFCHRYHSRYCLCGYHCVEEACDRSKDWRECSHCVPSRADVDRIPDKLWRGLNAHNFCPLLEKDVPRHSLCDTCAKCRRRFISSIEGYSVDSTMARICPGCAHRSV